MRGNTRRCRALLPKATAFGAGTQFNDARTTATGTVIQPHTQGNWGLRIDETLSLSGREFLSYSQSKNNVERSKFDFRAFQEDYLLTISLSYFEFLKARKGLEIADSNVERLTKYLSAARTRLKAGEITKTTVLRAEGELSGALSDQIKARNAYEITRVTLARLVSIERDFAILEIPVEEGKDRLTARTAECGPEEATRRQEPRGAGQDRGKTN